MDPSGSTAAFSSALARGITVLAGSTAMWITTSISGGAIADLCLPAAKRRDRSVHLFAVRRCTTRGGTKRHAAAANDFVEKFREVFHIARSIIQRRMLTSMRRAVLS
jgi:hypothetical protein